MPLNPTITKVKDRPLEVNESAKKIFQVIYSEMNKPESDADDDTPRIKVSTLISKMAFYYEKIRNSVDYKEEYLLRKNAIFRILKRKIIIEGALKDPKVEEMAKQLLVELIRAGYLPNNKIPETKIEEVKTVIGKYLKLKNFGLKNNQKDSQQKNELINWILAMCASEIEEGLSKNLVTDKIVITMYETIISNVKLPSASTDVKDKEIQIYIGIHRVYLKFDRDMLEFLLMKYFNANWLKADDSHIAEAANKLDNIRLAIDYQINHPLASQLNKIINSYAVFFTIMRDVIEDDPVGVYQSSKEDPKAFPRLIKRFCNKRYQSARAKLGRAAVRSIIYIFLTKMVLAVIVEVPLTTIFGEQLNYLSLAINVSFPPFLLFLIVLLTKVPSDANSEKIIKGIDEVIFRGKERREPYELRQTSARSSTKNIFFSIIYAITFFLTFGLIVWLLYKIQFNIFSMIIFLFFLTLVSFFGIRIRKVAREMFITETKESVISFVVDFFYVPVIAVGKWLNEKFSRLNVIVFILDFIIEAPFKVLVDITEEWTKYVKERKEEIS